MFPSKELKENGIAARKSLGQNFLINKQSLDLVVPKVETQKKTLEIGPGLGMLTSTLIELGVELCVVEVDNTLVKILRKKFSYLDIIHQDFLTTSPDKWEKIGIEQVIGNLPFNITTPILEYIILKMQFVSRVILGVQWEFAQRVSSIRGSSLGLFLQAAGDTSLIGKTSRNSFYPIPSVDAGWFLWERNAKLDNLFEFEVFLRGLFWGRRKNIRNCLLKNPHFSKHSFSKNWNIDKIIKRNELLSMRPDSLNIDDAIELFMELSS